jgi:hypothetical protein
MSLVNQFGFAHVPGANDTDPFGGDFESVSGASGDRRRGGIDYDHPHYDHPYYELPDYIDDDADYDIPANGTGVSNAVLGDAINSAIYTSNKIYDVVKSVEQQTLNLYEEILPMNAQVDATYTFTLDHANRLTEVERRLGAIETEVADIKAILAAGPSLRDVRDIRDILLAIQHNTRREEPRGMSW